MKKGGGGKERERGKEWKQEEKEDWIEREKMERDEMGWEG